MTDKPFDFRAMYFRGMQEIHQLLREPTGCTLDAELARLGTEELGRELRAGDRLLYHPDTNCWEHEKGPAWPEEIGIYRERAILLAVLALHYPAHVTPATDPEPGFTHVVCIHIGGAQHAWHIADSDFHLFMTLPRSENHWDGHTTEQKYASLETMARVVRPKGWGDE